MKNFYTDKPEKTFFAVYADLSGATLFTQTGPNKFKKCCDHEIVVDADWFVDAGYLWFFNVSESYAKMALENKEKAG